MSCAVVAVRVALLVTEQPKTVLQTEDVAVAVVFVVVLSAVWEKTVLVEHMDADSVLQLFSSG